MNKVPTTVFSGFLGSGKTTIILNLIDELQKKGKQVIYIKNEIGDEDVDGKIIQGKGIKTKELLNGCICCTLVGPFISSINEVIEKFNPDRIIIEASGAADPSALALMISSQPKLIRDGIIGIVDVVNFEGYKDLSVTSRNQTKFTDLIVFNKVEQVDLEKKKAVVGYVRELNSHSPIVEAPNGKVPSSIIFGLSTKDLDSLLEKESGDAHQDHEHHNHEHSDHIHEDNIQSFDIKPEGKFDKDKLENLLNSTSKNIFRAKGFVKLTDEDFYLFNTVVNRTDFEKLQKDEAKNNLLIFIGFKANEFEEEIRTKIEEIIEK